MGSEPTIPVFELTKTVYALDCAATVIGSINIIRTIKSIKRCAAYAAHILIVGDCLKNLEIDGMILLKLIFKMLNGLNSSG
jgi:hypothetical protein